MSYSYDTEKHFVFTDEGQRMLLRVRDFAEKAMNLSGAVRADKLMSAAGAGSSWAKMSCVDRLCELGELHLIPGTDRNAWQFGVYIR